MSSVAGAGHVRRRGVAWRGRQHLGGEYGIDGSCRCNRVRGKARDHHFGFRRDENALAMNLRFVLFGEGNVPWLVRELISKAEPDPAKQPRVIIG